MAQRLAHAFIALIATLGLAACGGGSDTADAAETNSGGGDLRAELATDRGIGDPDAPVTIIEYASLMCGACEFFHATTYPELKERYIDQGHVRFIFREFPTAPVNLAMAGFLLARCSEDEAYFDMIDVLFRQRMSLIEAAQSGDGAREAYLRIASSAGISETRFDECLGDRDEQLRIADVVDRAAEELGIEATPTFVINGEVTTEVRTLEEFAAVIDPLLIAAGHTPPSAEDDESAEDGADAEDG